MSKTNAFPLTVVFRSDWGVSTGTGIAGGIDSVIEKDLAGKPVVRGTVLTGVIREQAAIAAQALDDGQDNGPWTRFTGDLFGPGADDDGKDRRHQRRVIFSDATVPERQDVPIHEVVSLSIDDETGTARDDFLRFFERAGACRLEGTVTLVGEDVDGQELTWSNEQCDAARLLLALSGLLVRGIGSNRSDGDGMCDILIGVDPALHADGGEILSQVRRWCSQAMDHLSPEAPTVPRATRAFAIPHIASRTASSPVAEPEPAPSSGALQSPTWWSTKLTINLLTPVVSYDVPMSNEVRSLDFLRGTVLLPWVHRLLRRALPDDAAVRDAVVHGRLLVSDALPMVGDVVGLPTPLALSTPKVRKPNQCWREVTNRLRTGEPQDVHSPLRSGFVFPGLEVTPPEPSDGHDPLDKNLTLSGGLGVPPLTGRQATAHSTATGAAKDGALFLVRALPAGLTLQATLTLSEDLVRISGMKEALTAGAAHDARLGSRRLSGTYGHARCTFSPLTETATPPVAPGETTLWFTSDVLARSAVLGPGGSQQDLVDAFGRLGARLEVCRQTDDRFTAGIRHRRIDSWSTAGGQPRPTRTAIQAGSVLRVTVPDEAAALALTRLTVTGLGDLTAQGFGRFVVGHPLLDEKIFSLGDLRRSDFVGSTDAATSQEEQS